MIVINDNIAVSDIINEKANEIAQQIYPDEYNIWARGNWEAQNIRAAFKHGALAQREIDIERACKWIETYFGESHLEYFRKAMEEE